MSLLNFSTAAIRISSRRALASAGLAALSSTDASSALAAAIVLASSCSKSVPFRPSLAQFSSPLSERFLHGAMRERAQATSAESDNHCPALLLR